ncbi:DUF6538 domain-containing protein [Curvivirga sp.]|uniref:DUF6538 domain-containing protein n=1 Tax=Curvivirga sp. TaxID=2856848 RepID=UPI003B5B6A8D
MVDQNTPSYLYKKRGIWYFSKRVPSDVLEHHHKPRIIKCLRTTNQSHAIRLSRMYYEKLEAYWLSIRMQKMDFLLPTQSTTTHHLQSSNTPLLTEAKDTYIRLKGHGKGQVFQRTTERCIEYVAKALGNRPIGEYTSADAATFRDTLFERGLSSSSVTRIFSTIRSIINIAIQENGLDVKNAFARTFIPQKDDKEDRKPIPDEYIRKVQSECYKKDDSLRHLIALVSDTGMRLSEAVGLVNEDLHLDFEIPYINLRPHPWRPLKTNDSTRKIPLVGASLWAAQQLVSQEGFLFPQYNKTGTSNGNSASAAANKWLRSRVPNGCVMHSFRHSMRDRLRAVECPAGIINQIGGWHTAGVGEGYGNGFPIQITHKWLNRL